MTGATAKIAKLQDLPAREIELGPFGARWTDLGRDLGCVTSGLRRIEIVPGRRSTPAHVHGFEEELFYVLAGSGLSWQNGETYEVRAGDCLSHLPQGEAHTLVAGPEGLDVLVYSLRSQAEACFLPRAKIAWVGSTWVKAGDTPHPFTQEAAAGELELPEPSPRPERIVNLGDTPQRTRDRGDFRGSFRNLGKAAGSRAIGLQHVTLPAGARSFPQHCHSTEEEIFLVLEGEGICRLGNEEHLVGAGSLIVSPAGTGVAHGFRGGEQELVYLAFGERRSGDTIWYPDSSKISFPGLRVIGRLEPLSYWDGEV